MSVAVAFLFPEDTDGWFTVSLALLLRHDARGARHIVGDRGDIIALSSGPRIAEARSQVVDNFLRESASEWLWWLDADMTFQPDTLDLLLAHADPTERPILGGLCFAGGRSDRCYPTLYRETILEKDGKPTWVGVEPVLDYPKDRLVKVGATGSACVLIHRSVFTRMAQPWPRGFGTETDGKTPNPYPWYSEGLRAPDGAGIGEDISFPVDPATPVLGGDWRWRPIEDYSIGDTVLGFDEYPARSTRRFGRVGVTDVIERRLPRVRLVTDDVEIITTAEHPWLTRPADVPRAAWRWTPAGQIRVGTALAHVMPVAVNPSLATDDYAAGYVQGLLHSDGTRDRGGFVVRMKDTEPLERMATMLANLGIPSRRGAAWWDGDPRHASMHRLSLYGPGAMKADAIWHTQRFGSREFAAGYLAGMFDGDGSHNGGTIYIHSVVDAKKDRLEEAARMLGVPFSGRGPRSVWLNGQDNLFRFWQRTLPSLSRRTAPIGQRANDGVNRRGKEMLHRPAVLRAVESLPPGDVVCLTTTSGTFVADGLASHNCRRASLLDIPVHVHTGIRIGHRKRYELDETVFLERQAKLRVGNGSRPERRRAQRQLAKG